MYILNVTKLDNGGEVVANFGIPVSSKDFDKLNTGGVEDVVRIILERGGNNFDDGEKVNIEYKLVTLN